MLQIQTHTIYSSKDDKVKLRNLFALPFFVVDYIQDKDVPNDNEFNLDEFLYRQI